MNMHGASRLGWVRSLKEASSHASGEAADPAQADLAAASGRAPAAAGARSSRARGPAGFARTLTRSGRGLLVLAAAALLIPALAYADVPVATISGPLTVVEPGAGDPDTDAVYTVTLTGGIGSADVVFDYTVTGTATAGENADYTDPENGKLTILATTPAAERDTGAITLNVKGDTVQEAGETLIVTLTKVSTEAGVVTLGAEKAVRTTIMPPTTKTVSVTGPDRLVTEDNSDNVAATFTVEVAGETSVPISLRYETVPGSASANDYTAASATGTVEIDAGTDQSTTFTVETEDDNLAEDDEVFTVSLTLLDAPADMALGFATAMVTIDDDDDLTATVTARQDTVVEGSDAVFNVMLKRGTSPEDGAGSEAVVITYHTTPLSGTDTTPATAADDYEASSGTLTIPAGETMGTIVISTLLDDVREGPETLRITLTAATTAAGMITDPSSSETIDIGDSGGTVTVSVADTTGEEGKAALFPVKLSGHVSADVVLAYTTEPDTADATDFVAETSGRLTVQMGETTGTITVLTTDDDAAPETEANESFIVRLLENDSTLPPDVMLGTTAATATITDNDVPEATVSGPEIVAEGEVAEYFVTLKKGTGSDEVLVAYAVSGTAVAGEDYEAPTSGTLEIFATESVGTISIQTISDENGDETLTVTLNSATTTAGRVTVGTPRSATTTLAPEGATTLSVADLDSVTEGTPAVFTAKLSKAATSEVKARWETAPGSAQAMADYGASSASGTVTFDDTTEMFTVDTVDDGLAENDENFTVTLTLLGAPVNVVAGPRGAMASATIKDKPITARLTVEDSVKEGTDAVFTITLTGGTSTEDVVVKYTVGAGEGNGVEANDYVSSDTSVTVAAGESTAQITIATVEDDVREPSESLKVTLTEGRMGLAIVNMGLDPPEPEEAEITIEDAIDAVRVSVAGTTITEGEPAVFTVTLSGKVSTPVLLSYAAPTAGDGTVENDDYETADLTGDLTIEPNTTSKTFMVRTTDDNDAEDEETLDVMLSFRGVRPAGVAPGTMSASAKIRDNERLTVGVEGPQRVRQNATDNFQITLTGGDPTDDIAVHYTLGDTTTSTDITVSGNTVTLPEIEIPTADTGTVSITLNRVEPGAGTVALGTRTARTEIVSSDTSTVKVEVTANPTEGGMARFTVSRDSGTTNTDPVTVSFATAPGSASTADYTTTRGTVELTDSGAGSSTVVTVDTRADDIEEATETFALRLSGSLPNGVVFETTQATAEITDGDMLEASVPRSGGETVLEGETATFVVTLTDAGSAPVVISYSVGGTATAGEDYTAPGDKLTIPAGRTSGTIAIRTRVDDILEPLDTSADTTSADTITVTLTGASTTAGEAEYDDMESAPITIGDSGGTVLVSVAGTTITEGEPAVFTVTLSGKVSTPVLLSYAAPTAGDGTVENDDYETADLTGDLTIEPNTTSKTFMVRTTDDNDAEDEETLDVMLSFRGVRPAGVAPGTMSASAKIRDNERLTVGVEGPQRVRQNATDNFQITLTGGDPTDDIAVHYTLGDTTTSTDITVSGNTVTLPEIEIPTADTGTVSITLNRVEPGAGTVALGTRTARTEIVSSDTSTVKVEVTANPTEGGMARFTVSRDSGTTNTDPVTVSFATAPGSASTADYTTTRGTVELTDSGAGSSTVVTVDTRADDIEEATETFALRLSGVYRTAWCSRRRRQRPRSLTAICWRRQSRAAAVRRCWKARLRRSW